MKSWRRGLLVFLAPFHAAVAAPLPRAEPEAEGVDRAGVEAFIAAAESQQLGLHSFMLVRHGRVVAEAWWKPGAPAVLHPLYSITKNFTAAAAGIAIDEGRLLLDDRVADWLSDELPATVSANLAAMRVRDLLTMTAGHERDPMSAIKPAPANGNWVRAVLAQPVKFPPGTHFAYSNAAALLLSAVVQRATGQRPHDYLKARLFVPLGISGEEWETYPDGRNIGGWGLQLKTDDLAKFGQLYLQHGKWEGRRILSTAWVAAATSRHSASHYGSDPDFAHGYGYTFWLTPEDGYRGFGSLGQICLVLPARDAVIVITAENRSSRALSRAIWDHLVPALLSRGLPNSNGLDRDQDPKAPRDLEVVVLVAPSG